MRHNPTIRNRASNSRMKALTVVLALTISISIATPSFVVASSTVERWALVIGIANYQSISDLSYTDDDAQDVRNALLSLNWESDHITTLIDSSASKTGIQTAITSLVGVADSDDIFLFFFSGHGTYGPDLSPIDEIDGYDEYICPWDTVSGYASSYIRDDELTSWLDQLPCNKVVVLDSCFSGGFLKADLNDGGQMKKQLKTLEGIPRVTVKDSFQRDLNKAGYVTLTACDDHELSYEYAALQNGVFTYFFVQGIAPTLPADSDQDGWVSAEEAFAYAASRTTNYNSAQHPQMVDGINGEVELGSLTTPPQNIPTYQVDGTSYSWIELDGISMGLLMGDETVTTVLLPFPIQFYNHEYDNLTIGSNGYLNLENQYLGYSNQPIPSSNSYGVNKIIAVYWDDLIMRPSTDKGSVYVGIIGDSPSRKIVIEWKDVYRLGYPGTITFEIIFSENNPDIIMQYKDVFCGSTIVDRGASATVGIQYDSNHGTQYSYNQAILSDGLGLKFSLNSSSIGWVSSITVVRGNDDYIYYQNPDAFPNSWTQLPSGLTIDSPAATLIGNELHVVVRSTDGASIWHSYVNNNDGSFSGWTLLSGVTPSAPTLTTNGTHLFLVVRGYGDEIFYRSYALSSRVWSGWMVLPSGFTCDSPAATILNNKLQIVVRSTDGSTIWHCSVDLSSGSFSGWVQVGGLTPSSPTLTTCVSRNEAILVVRGLDNVVYRNTWSGYGWEGWTSVPGAFTSYGVGAAAVGEELHLAFQGVGDGAIWTGKVNLFTGSSSGWAMLNRGTPSKPIVTG